MNEYVITSFSFEEPDVEPDIDTELALVHDLQYIVSETKLKELIIGEGYQQKSQIFVSD